MISTKSKLRKTGRSGRDARATTEEKCTRAVAETCRILVATGVLVWGATAGGCAGRPASLGESAERHDVDGTVRTLEADWDDLDAALDAALSACEVAVLTRAGDQRRVERADDYDPEPYEDFVETAIAWAITTRDGRPGEMQATRPVSDAMGVGRDNEITLRVRIGLFGTPSEEACVLDAMTSRLERLRGSVAAPL